MKDLKYLGFDKGGRAPLIVEHAFTFDGGILRHYTDGTLRAEVEAKNVNDYIASCSGARAGLDDEVRKMMYPKPVEVVEDEHTQFD